MSRRFLLRRLLADDVDRFYGLYAIFCRRKKEKKKDKVIFIITGRDKNADEERKSGRDKDLKMRVEKEERAIRKRKKGKETAHFFSCEYVKVEEAL